MIRQKAISSGSAVDIFKDKTLINVTCILRDLVFLNFQFLSVVKKIFK